MPFIPSAGEMKTKPTQHSVKELRSIGIQPDVLMCRCDRPIPKDERRKIALFCNVRESAVIQAMDVDTIYDVPNAYHREGLDEEVLSVFGIKDAPEPNLASWQTITHNIREPEGDVTIAIVGKYTGLKDAYKSLSEALVHGGIANKVRVNVKWVESEIFDTEDTAFYLEDVDGILVPGGFRRARQPGQDPRGGVRAHAQRALFRHLLRHADGGDRGAAEVSAGSPAQARRSSDRRTNRSSA